LQVDYIERLLSANPLLVSLRDDHGWTALLRAA